MFRISNVLAESRFPMEYRIEREKEFETLALCAMQVSKKVCSFLDDIRYIDSLSESVTMLITTPEIAETLSTEQYGLVITEQPRIMFFMVHNYLANNQNYARQVEKNNIAESAKVSPLAYIAEENVTIGENVVIEPFVTIYPNVSIGDNTIIRSGAKIGGVGFEFKRETDGVMAVAHLGGVEIGRNVEIQNNTCVDKAVYPWDNTVIADSVKIDNLVHVGHAVKIGRNTMVVANVGLGGRTVIGENVWIGFGATLRNGLTIGDNARVNMGAVVTKNVEQGQSVSGNFAIEHKQFIQIVKEWQNRNTT